MSDNTPIDAVTEIAKSTRSFADLAKDLLSPTITKRQTAAELRAIEDRINFAKDHPEVKFIIQEDGTPGFVTSSEQELLIRTERRLIANAVQKQANLEQVYLNAAKDINDIHAIPDKPIEKDFLARLNSIAQDISDEEMQFIWGKILAGEFQKPGSFSLRTLETVRNLSRAEAEAFQRILPLTISNSSALLLPNDKVLLEEYHIPYQSLIALDESGLINSDGLKILNLPFDQTKEHILFSRKHMIKISADSEFSDTIKLSIYLLTKAAMELQSILSFEPNYDFIKAYLQKISSDNKVTVSLYEIHAIYDKLGKIEHASTPIEVFSNP